LAEKEIFKKSKSGNFPEASWYGGRETLLLFPFACCFSSKGIYAGKRGQKLGNGDASGGSRRSLSFFIKVEMRRIVVEEIREDLT